MYLSPRRPSHHTPWQRLLHMRLHPPVHSSTVEGRHTLSKHQQPAIDPPNLSCEQLLQAGGCQGTTHTLTTACLPSTMSTVMSPTSSRLGLQSWFALESVSYSQRPACHCHASKLAARRGQEIHSRYLAWPGLGIEHGLQTAHLHHSYTPRRVTATVTAASSGRQKSLCC